MMLFHSCSHFIYITQRKMHLYIVLFCASFVGYYYCNHQHQSPYTENEIQPTILQPTRCILSLNFWSTLRSMPFYHSDTHTNANIHNFPIKLSKRNFPFIIFISAKNISNIQCFIFLTSKRITKQVKMNKTISKSNSLSSLKIYTENGQRRIIIMFLCWILRSELKNNNIHGERFVHVPWP